MASPARRVPFSFGSSGSSDAACAAAAPGVVSGVVLASNLRLDVHPFYFFATLVPFTESAPTREAHLRSLANGWRGAGNVSLVNSDPALLNYDSVMTLQTGSSRGIFRWQSRLVPYVENVTTVANDDQLGVLNPLTLSQTTATTALCTINDIRSFSSTRIRAATSLATNFSLKCSGISSVFPEQTQVDCTSDAACLGYVTGAVARQNAYQEETLCLVFTGTSPSDPFLGTERLLFLKPTSAERTCRFSLNGTGGIRVFLQQTFFGSGQATISAVSPSAPQLSTVLSVCGGRAAFVGGRLKGVSSRCNEWFECFSGAVAQGTTLSITAALSLAQGGCANALGALVVANFSELPEPPPAPRQYVAEVFPNTLLLRKTASEGRLISVYVVNVARVLLLVAQTGYECRADTPCRATPAAIRLLRLTGSTQRTLQQCGGRASFAFNVSGASDQCDEFLHCGRPIFPLLGLDDETAPTGATQPSVDAGNRSALSGTIGAAGGDVPVPTLFSGWLQIDASTSEIARLSRFELCPFFTGRLESTPYASDAAAWKQPFLAPTGFPLREAPSVAGGRLQFRPLLLAPLGTNVTSASASVYGLPVSPLPHLADQFAASDDPLEAFLVNWSAAVNVSLPLQLPVDLACVMDSLEDTASCAIPIPPGANYVTLTVAQTFMSKNSIAVQLVGEASKTAIWTRRCGASQGFGGLPSRDGKCQMFQQCYVGTLRLTEAQLARNGGRNATHLRLRVPQAVGTGDLCPYAFAAVAKFVAKPLPANATPALTSQTLFCDSGFSSVDVLSVCDNVLDCPDGADEALCYVWHPVEWDTVLWEPIPLTRNATTSYNVSIATAVSYGLSECRSRAVSLGSSVFALSSNRSWCILYHPSFVENFVKQPGSFNFTDTHGFTLYAMLPDGPLSYPRCSEQLSCSGHGVVLPHSVPLQTEDSVAGNACRCFCDASFTGDDCSVQLDLAFVGSIIVAAPLLNGATEANFSADDVGVYIAAVTADEAFVSVSCSPVQLVSLDRRGHLLFSCEAAAYAASDLLAFREVVRDKSVPMKLSSLLGVAVEVFESSVTVARLHNCSFGDAGGTCFLRPRSNLSVLSAVLITTVASSRLDGVLRVSFFEDASRQGRTEMALAAESSLCSAGPDGNTAFSLDSSGCIVTTCRMDSRAILGAKASSVSQLGLDFSALASAGGAALSADPCFQPPVVDASYAPLIPELEAVASVVNTAATFSPYLVGGFVAVITAVFLTLAGVAFKLLDVRRSAAAAHVDACEVSQLRRMLISTLLRMGYYHDSERPVKPERLSLAAAVYALVFIVAGIFLVLYFYTSTGYNSNVEVLIETYRSSLCNMSSFAPTPTQLVRVAATSSRECVEREVAGMSFGSAIFVSAFCEDPASAMVKAGFSVAECQTKKYLAISTAGSACLPVGLLLSSAVNDTGYFSVWCAPVSSVARRMSAALAATPGASQTMTDSSYVRPLRPAWHQAHQPPAPYFTHPRHQFKRFQRATSATSRSRLEAVANATTIIGSANTNRLIALVNPDTFDDPVEPFTFPSIDDAAAAFSKDMSAPLDEFVRSLGPANGDYPVGFMYNGYKPRNRVWEQTVGPESARYFGVQGTVFDIGALMQGAERDGDGVTIMFYLRATPDTVGFVFATADAREHLASDISPLLSKLRLLQESGGASSWFAANYSVYSALYIEGPSGTLSFAYADPSLTSPDAAVSVEWDLWALDLQSLLNGRWHHVAIILRSENSQLKAQLSVDGETSLSRVGWNQCLSRGPSPVQGLAVGEKIPTTSDRDERVMAGGMLHAGYFNGGLAHLDVVPSVLSVYSIWRLSAGAIVARHAPKMTAYLALAVVLFACGLGMLCILLTSAGRHWHRVTAAASCDAQTKALSLYEELWSSPKDQVSIEYAEMPYRKAREVVGLTDDVAMHLFLKEIRCHFSFDSRRRCLIRVLYRLATGGGNNGLASSDALVMPSPTMWSKVSSAQTPAEMATPQVPRRTPEASYVSAVDDVSQTSGEGSGIHCAAETEIDEKGASSKVEVVTCAGGEASPAENLLWSLWYDDQQSPTSTSSRAESPRWAERKNMQEPQSLSPGLEAAPRAAMMDMFTDSISLGSIEEMVEGMDVTTALDLFPEAEEAEPCDAQSLTDPRDDADKLLAELVVELDDLLPSTKHSDEEHRPSDTSRHQGPGDDDHAEARPSTAQVEKMMSVFDLFGDFDEAVRDDGDESPKEGCGSGQAGAFSPVQNLDAAARQQSSFRGDVSLWDLEAGEDGLRFAASPQEAAAAASLAGAPSVPRLLSPEASMFVPRNFSGMSQARQRMSKSGLNLSVISVNVGSPRHDDASEAMLQDVAVFSSEEEEDFGGDLVSQHETDKKASRRNEEKEDLSEDEATTAAEAPDGETGGNDATLGDIFVPVVMVLQSVYIYLTAMNVPPLYQSLFGGIFSFISFDWTKLLPMPSLLLPLLQLVIGLLALCLLFYLLHSDELHFAWYLAQYTLKRDEQEGLNIVPHEKVLAAMQAPFGRIVDYPATLLAAILPLRTAQRVAQYLQGSRPGGCEPLLVRAHVAPTDGGLPSVPTMLTVLRSSTAPLGGVVRRHGILEEPIKQLDVRCPWHAERRLSSQRQTLLWPFTNKPRCCATTDGSVSGQCGISTGVVYRCGKDEMIASSGQPTQCSFSLCAMHYHGTLTDHIAASILGSIRSTTDGGAKRFLIVAALAIATLAYTPFVRTAIMILSCHPYYQCLFGKCWEAKSQTFVLSAYLAIVMVAFLGAGLPLVLFLLLRRRQRMMEDVFFAAEFGGRFGSSESRVLALAEWQSFVSTDTSALASLYCDFQFQWFYISPVLLAWKVVLMAPPIFLEMNSFTQLAGCAAVEILFGTFMFAVNPASSVVVNSIYRLSSIHQVVFLGLLSLENFRQFHGQSSLQLYMVGLTIAYLALCLGIIFAAQVLPVICAERMRQRMTHLLSRCGIPFSETCPIYLLGTTASSEMEMR